MFMFETVRNFEEALADYYNAPYAVATDSCTHAIELCLRKTTPEHVVIPSHTYISIPFTLMKLDISWEFKDIEWHDLYFLRGTRIIDGAVNFKRNSFIPGYNMCLSFQHKKMLGLGRGGAILCSNKDEYDTFKQMSYDGRVDNKPWAEQDIEQIGYHYYMTPETAAQGIELLKSVNPEEQKQWTDKDYPYLPNMKVFK